MAVSAGDNLLQPFLWMKTCDVAFLTSIYSQHGTVRNPRNVVEPYPVAHTGGRLGIGPSGKGKTQTGVDARRVSRRPDWRASVVDSSVRNSSGPEGACPEDATGFQSHAFFGARWFCCSITARKVV